MDKENKQHDDTQDKGGLKMNAYAVKPSTAFATKSPLKRTPQSKQAIDIANFLDTNDFSFHVDKKTKKLTINTKGKK